jgi:hypothetical protein
MGVRAPGSAVLCCEWPPAGDAGAARDKLLAGAYVSPYPLDSINNPYHRMPASQPIEFEHGTLLAEGSKTL